jgi:chromosome segregation ATPase
MANPRNGDGDGNHNHSNHHHNSSNSKYNGESESSRNARLNQMLSERNGQLQKQYERVASLTELLDKSRGSGAQDDQDTEQLREKVVAQVTYINELQEINDQMYGENKQMQQKLIALQVAPMESQERVEQAERRVRDLQTQHIATLEELEAKLHFEEQRGQERDHQRLLERKKEQTRLATLDSEVAEFTLRETTERRAGRELMLRIKETQAQATALCQVIKAHEAKERPDLTLLLGTAETEEDDQQGGDEGGNLTDAYRGEMVARLVEARQDLQGIRDYLADYYARSISDDCALQ